METVHLHLGSYKTGTSSIQHTFYNSKEELYEQGFHYPGSQSNHHLSFFATKAEEADWPRQFRSINQNSLQKSVNTYFEELKRGFKDGNGQQIISTEYLFIKNETYIENYIKFLKDYFGEVKVYLFLRNPVDYFRSFQQQMVKARSFVENPRSWCFPFRRVLQAWKQFTDVKVIAYQKDQDSCEVLCQKIGIDYNKLRKPQKKSNTSLSIEQMLLLEKIQHHLYKQHENRFKNHLGVIQNVNHSFTTKPQLQEWVKPVIYQNHREDLKWLKEEYGIDFLNEELGQQEVTSAPTFENGKATVRDVYKVPSEETVEKYEALVVDALLKKLVQNKQN